MSLRSKLTRLGPPPTLPSSGTGVRGGATTEGDARSQVLEELRRKMDALVGPLPERAAPTRASVEQAAPLRAPWEGPAGLGDLPFSEVDVQGRPLLRRLETLGPSARVGRISLDAAGLACPRMLALLGLDPELQGCDPRGALYLDTETTGLGGSGSVAFLVGLCWFDAAQGSWMLEQLFLRTPAEEPALLDLVRERVAKASLLVTYNGKSFDCPLLDTRLVMNRQPALPRRPHLDLLPLARRLHKRRLGSCRLVHLESHVLGWERNEDDIPGFEIPPRYGHFLRTGDGEALRPVIEHNAWDVLSMAALVGLYGEPLPALHADDLVGMARTLRRAGDLDGALRVAEAALAQGAGAAALRARGEIAKARGDKARALADFEVLSAEVDDPTVRLELAKLYEHFVGEPTLALAVTEAGTGESEVAWLKRRDRLTRKASSGPSRGRVARRPKGAG